MDLSLQRGAIPVDLDRTRILFYDHAATWALIQKYGQRFILSLYDTKEEDGRTELVLQSMDVLAFFLFAGLQADAKRNGETLTEEQAAAFLHSWNFAGIFRSVVWAVIGNTATPEMVGKAQATGPAAKPAARKTPPNLGPAKVTTSSKRSGSRSRFSAGARKGSGPRPSAS